MRHPKNNVAGLLVEFEQGRVTISSPGPKPQPLHSLDVTAGAWEEMFDAVLTALRAYAKPTRTD